MPLLIYSWYCAKVINDILAPKLIGKNPLDIAGCDNVSVPEWRIVQNTDDASIVKAFGGIEIVLWDIRGKVWNQPLYQHLSNLMRNGRNLDEIK